MSETKPRVCTDRLELRVTRELIELLQAISDGRGILRPRVARAGIALVCTQLLADLTLWSVVRSAELAIASPFVADAVRRGEVILRRSCRINFSSTVELDALLNKAAALVGVHPTKLAICALAHACKILDDDPTPRAVRIGLPPDFVAAELAVMPLVVAFLEKKRLQREREKAATRRRRREAARGRTQKVLKLTPIKRRAATVNAIGLGSEDDHNR